MEKYLKIVTVLVIINLVIFISLMFINNENKGGENVIEGAQTQEEYFENPVLPSQSEIEEMNKDLVSISNMREITSIYTGTTPIAKISVIIVDTLQNIVNVIIKKNDNELEKYFSENKELVKKRLKIEKPDQLKEMKQKVEFKITKAKIKEKSTSKKNEYIMAKIEITTEKNKINYLELEINQTTGEVYIY